MKGKCINYILHFTRYKKKKFKVIEELKSDLEVIKNTLIQESKVKELEESSNNFEIGWQTN